MAPIPVLNNYKKTIKENTAMSDNSELNRLLQQKSKLTHDLKAKRLFSLKQVVARLLKECIPEYRDCQLEDIVEYIPEKDSKQS